MSRMRTLAILWLVARHEMRLAWRGRVLLVLTLVATLLLSVAATLSAARLGRDADARARYQVMVAEQWRDQPDRHPHRVAHYGWLVFRPIAPLALFDPGVERFTGTSLFLEAHRANLSNFTDATESDGLLRVGDLSPAMVVQLMLPLFVFVVAAVSVTREREQGSLGLLRCQGASGAAILGGKLVGALGAAVAVMVPGLIVTGLVLAWAGGFSGWSIDASLFARVGGLAAAHTAYLLAIAALAVALASWQRTTRGAIVAGLSVWIVLMIVVPRLIVPIASALHPVPARSTFTADVERHIRRLGDGHNPNDPRFQAFRAEALAAHGVTRVEDLPMNYNGLVSAESERLTTQANREELARLHDIYARQQRLVTLAGVVNPYLAIRSVSMALSGVDVAHASVFEAQAEDYRFALVQYLNGLHAHEVSHALDRYVETAGDAVAPSRQRIDREHWVGAPSFEPRPPALGEAVAGQMVPLMSLGLWAVGLAAVVMATGRRRV
jgi:ABC-2 type transport system permease protein